MPVFLKQKNTAIMNEYLDMTSFYKIPNSIFPENSKTKDSSTMY